MLTPGPDNRELPWNVITGAAHGFGRALALELAAEGRRLLLSDIDLPALDETARLAREAGAREVRTLRVDVTRPEDFQSLLRECAGSPVELLINNAGVCSAGAFEELTLEDWRWTLDIDLYGVLYGCHAFLPLFRKQGFGALLNVASAAGLLNPPNLSAYNVAKA